MGALTWRPSMSQFDVMSPDQTTPLLRCWPRKEDRVNEKKRVFGKSRRCPVIIASVT
jgi:hypothetical protein